MSDNNRPNVPTELISAVLSAAMSGADALICGKTKAVICITPKAAAALAAIGKGDEESVDGHDVPEFLRKLVVEQGLKVIGTMPDGSLVRLTNDANDSAESLAAKIAARAGRCH